MIIRLPQLKDLKTLNGMCRKISLLHYEKMPNVCSITEQMFTKENILKLANKEGGYLVVAENLGQIAGFAYASIIKEGDDIKTQKKTIYYLDAIYVESKYRNSHIGGQMYKKVLEQGRKLKERDDIDEMRCRIWGFNKASFEMTNKNNIKPLYTVYQVF